MNIIYCISGFILGYFLASHLTARYYSKRIKNNEKLADAMKKATGMVAEKLNNNNKWFNELQTKRDKEYKEKQLKIKLKAEEDKRKIDEEVFQEIKNL